jgi:hypothetical protein
MHGRLRHHVGRTSVVIASAPAPATVTITLSGPLNDALRGTDTAVRLAALVEREIPQLLSRLGVARHVAVTIEGAEAPSNSMGPAMQLSVNHQTVLWPDELVQIIAQRFPWGSVPDLDDWAARITEPPPDRPVDAGTVATFLGTVVIEAAKGRPDVLAAGLVTPAQAHALGLGFSIAEWDRFEREMLACGETLDPARLGEILLPLLRDATLRVEIDSDYLESVTGLAEVDGPIETSEPRLGGTVREYFDFLRDGLFTEIGIRVPTIELVPIERLGERCFRVAVRATPSTLIQGLAPERLLVNGSASWAQGLGVAADPAINPATLQQNAVIASRDLARLPSTTTWNAMQYIVLVCAQELRRHAAHLIDVDVVERELALLRRYFPALVEAVVEVLPTTFLAPVFRALLGEGIRIRDLPVILGRLVAFAVARGGTSALTGDALRDAVADTREELARFIGQKYVANGTLAVVLLDPELERQLERATETGAVAIGTQLRIELARLARSDWRSVAFPPILTGKNVRDIVRALIREEFPRIGVISYNELSPDLNVRPLDRISLPPS